MNLEEKILQAYKDGTDLGYIIESLNIPYKKVKKVLDTYKEQNREGRTFSEGFRKMIANRDMNGVPRKQIATELGISSTTVKRACTKFGNVNKVVLASNKGDEYTIIDKPFSNHKCPECESIRVNVVDLDTIFCMDCNGEFFKKDGVTYKVNWENID